eukprot:3938291-Rhodomonas_salina.2
MASNLPRRPPACEGSYAISRSVSPMARDLTADTTLPASSIASRLLRGTPAHSFAFASARYVASLKSVMRLLARIAAARARGT